MLKLSSTTKFNKDIKLCKKRNYDLNLLYNIVDNLRIPASLPIKNRDHNLKGHLSDKRECHIAQRSTRLLLIVRGQKVWNT